MKGKIFKLVLFLIVMAFASVVGFAYVGNLSPQQTDTRQPVILNVD